MKWPGTAAAYAIGFSVFGESTAGVHLTLLIVNAATIGLAFGLAGRMGGPIAAVVAAAAQAILSINPMALGLAAHATHFVAFFALAGAWILWETLQRPARVAGLLVAGVLFGLAGIMKQPGLAFLLFALAATILSPSRRSIRTAFVEVASLLIGAATPIALMAGYFVLTGDFAKFWYWTVTYGRHYATLQSWAHAVESLRFNLRLFTWSTEGIAIAGLIGSTAPWWWSGCRGPKGFILGFLLLAALATSPGFYFRNHYFLVMAPPLALGAGLLVAAIRDKLSGQHSFEANLIAGALAAILLGWPIVAQAKYLWRTPARELGRLLYSPNPFLESEEIAGYLAARCPAGERIAVIGSEPQIYFLSGRRAATEFLYTYALMENHPHAEAMQWRMIEQIEAARPAYLVFVQSSPSWIRRREGKEPIFEWYERYAAKNYNMVGVAVLTDARPTVYYWDSDVAKAPAGVSHFLLVWRRKPDGPR